MELTIGRILKVNAQVFERTLEAAKEQLVVLGTLDVSSLLHQSHGVGCGHHEREIATGDDGSQQEKTKKI